MSGKRSRLWWYRRMRTAYKKHGVTIRGRRQAWQDAVYARRCMAPSEQRSLKQLKK